MKRNSNPDLSALPERSPIEFKARIETESAVTWSRRAVLVAVGLFSLAPRFALGSVFQCGPKLQISVLAALTGPSASMQARYYCEGVEQAVKTANARGCPVALAIRDADSSPTRLVMEALAAERGGGGSSVIIAPFGPAAGRLVAQKVSSALIFDISEKSPLGSRPVNLVTLPYAIFFTADPGRRDESLRTLGRVAAGIVLETIQSSVPGTISSPSGMIDAMARRKFSSPKGILSLDPTSGAFELIR